MSNRAASAMVITDVFPSVNAVGIHRTVRLSGELVPGGWERTVSLYDNMCSKESGR